MLKQLSGGGGLGVGWGCEDGIIQTGVIRQPGVSSSTWHSLNAGVGILIQSLYPTYLLHLGVQRELR